ncbi:hypothetical protein P4O66_011677 [Electrophorus voltai]|uniref:Thioredoxin domain-containing protein n=1 Tax=Electrophorus voltai TaxID=2609070 RepID=A0AAD8Z8A2_9TELE|nr:hypothetical protein P4O66_011677 [Electrophorus voltai]
MTVTDANWTLILEGEWMLKFYAPWCPACQHIQADWEALAKESKNLGISVGKVDVTQQPGLSLVFMLTFYCLSLHCNMLEWAVSSYHTANDFSLYILLIMIVLRPISCFFISHCSAKDGSFRRYMSSRTTEDIRAMSGMAGLFRLSVWIRQIHTYLMETFGIPSWGSYVIFAIITLFMGLLLGLMLVLIADCICPSRPKHKVDKTVYVKAEGSEDEVDGAPTEDKRMSDLDNESERVSAEESTDEEGIPVSEIAASSSDEPQPEGAAEASVRKRKPRGPNSPAGT